MMPGMRKEQGTELARELCETLRESVFLTGEGLSLTVTGSFGMATFPEDGESVHAMLRSADSMMYEVKNSTRNDMAVMGEPREMRSLKPIMAERRVHGVR